MTRSKVLSSMARETAGRKAPRTKTGCWTCRERKVRCDEQKPNCGNCSRLSLGCAGYGARITFRDDTPRVLQRMEPVTDVQGCSVYERSPGGKPCAAQGKLRYRTYTPAYFEKHTDIEIETDLLELSSHVSQSPTILPQYSPASLQPYLQSPPELMQDSPYLYSSIEYVNGQKQWLDLPTSCSDMTMMPVTSYGVPYSDYPQGFEQPEYTPPIVCQSRNTGAALTSPARARALSITIPSPVKQNPQIKIDAYAEYDVRPQLVDRYDTALYDSSSNTASLTTVASKSPSTAGLPYPSHAQRLSPEERGHPASSLGLHNEYVGIRKVDQATLRRDERPPRSPASFKWTEHFGGAVPTTGTSATNAVEIRDGQNQNFVPQDIRQALSRQLDLLGTVQEDRMDAEHYLNHYFTSLAAQLSFPDRGAINPFRMLLTSLCQQDSTLLHAVMAYSATDLARNDPLSDSVKVLSHAQQHYEAAVSMLRQHLDDPRTVPGTGSLATCYLLFLTDVKNVVPLKHVSVMARIVAQRVEAGQIYEGGVCWTWYSATLGVVSAMFGGQDIVMSQLVDNGQLPIPGQGNMYPFIKKTEQQRIEHTIISPMYVSTQQWWVKLSKLASLANRSPSSGGDLRSAVQQLKSEIEIDWKNRVQLVDDLTSDDVEEVFRTKWVLGPPVAEHIMLMYNTARLYAELLVRETYSKAELKSAVTIIVGVFDKLTAAKTVFYRRYILVSIFLCTIICPDVLMRKQIIRNFADVVCNEPSWKKALEVTNSLFLDETTARKGDSTQQGHGPVRWSDVRDRLGGITLF